LLAQNKFKNLKIKPIKKLIIKILENRLGKEESHNFVLEMLCESRGREQQETSAVHISSIWVQSMSKEPMKVTTEAVELL